MPTLPRWGSRCPTGGGRLLNNVRFIDQLMYTLLSSVGGCRTGWWAASLRRKAPPTTAQQCAAVLES